MYPPSRPPSAATAASTIASTSAFWLTSPGTATPRTPFASTCFTAASSAVRDVGRSLRARSYPSLANRNAIARPIPWDAPVTRAIRRGVAMVLETSEGFLRPLVCASVMYYYRVHQYLTPRLRRSYRYRGQRRPERRQNWIPLRVLTSIPVFCPAKCQKERVLKLFNCFSPYNPRHVSRIRSFGSSFDYWRGFRRMFLYLIVEFGLYKLF